MATRLQKLIDRTGLSPEVLGQLAGEFTALGYSIANPPEPNASLKEAMKELPHYLTIIVPSLMEYLTIEED